MLKYSFNSIIKYLQMFLLCQRFNCFMDPMHEATLWSVSFKMKHCSMADIEEVSGLTSFALY